MNKTVFGFLCAMQSQAVAWAAIQKPYTAYGTSSRQPTELKFLCVFDETAVRWQYEFSGCWWEKGGQSYR
jgi:hypothetical protein